MSSEATSSQPSRKRARASDTDTPIRPHIVRHPILWLDDGNVVLRTTLPAAADSPAIQTLHKVHKSILALNATFFADMFARGMEASGVVPECYEGVPVIDMPDDSVEMEQFLKAIMISSWLSDVRRECEASCAAACFPSEFAPVLRLATKYGATAIRKATVDALESAWPSTLAAWDKQQAALISKWHASARNAQRPQCHLSAATALRLAYDCNVYSVLPALYYDLARGYNIQVPFRCGYDHLSQHRADLSELTGVEITRLLIGVSRLHYDLIYHTRFPDCLDVPLNGPCSERVGCSFARSDWWKEQFNETFPSAILLMQDPLAYIMECQLGFHAWAAGALCDSCLKRPAPVVADLRAQIWWKLPATFDLSGLVPDGWGAAQAGSTD